MIVSEERRRAAEAAYAASLDRRVRLYRDRPWPWWMPWSTRGRPGRRFISLGDLCDLKPGYFASLTLPG